jgi:hypothetical protein
MGIGPANPGPHPPRASPEARPHHRYRHGAPRHRFSKRVPGKTDAKWPLPLELGENPAPAAPPSRPADHDADVIATTWTMTSMS